jgi:hypothetical protein
MALPDDLEYPDPTELDNKDLATFYMKIVAAGDRMTDPSAAFVTGLWLGLLCGEETPRFGHFTLQAIQLMLARARKIPLEVVEKEGIDLAASILEAGRKI